MEIQSDLPKEFDLTLNVIIYDDLNFDKFLAQHYIYSSSLGINCDKSSTKRLCNPPFQLNPFQISYCISKGYMNRLD